MCTAINENGTCHLFGRTLDVECSRGERICILQRGAQLEFLHEGKTETRHAIIGTAFIDGGTPLYFDAMNECGLAVAALSFPVSAVYHSHRPDKHNIASYELPLWVLTKCETSHEAALLLRDSNVTGDARSEDLGTTPLHWLVSDAHSSFSVESVKEGIKIYENPVGVLTNEPPFPYHLTRLCDYAGLSAEDRHGKMTELLSPPYSRGLGAFGLPGDFSSCSRFARAAFVKLNTCHEMTERTEVERFFRLLDCVSVPRGCVMDESKKSHYTVYSSCMSTQSGSYYYSTYNNRSIRCVSFYDHSLDGGELLSFEM